MFGQFSISELNYCILICIKPSQAGLCFFHFHYFLYICHTILRIYKHSYIRTELFLKETFLRQETNWREDSTIKFQLVQFGIFIHKCLKPIFYLRVLQFQVSKSICELFPFIGKEMLQQAHWCVFVLHPCVDNRKRPSWFFIDRLYDYYSTFDCLISSNTKENLPFIWWKLTALDRHASALN